MSACYSIVDFLELESGLIFDPEHYHPDRIKSWQTLSKDSSQNVDKYFAEVSETGLPGEDTESFDLTDALGCFLSGEGSFERSSQKKRAIPYDILVSRLRTYLKEICIVPNRQNHFNPFISTEFIVLRSITNKANWLLPFLLSRHVQTVFKWSQTGNNHPRIHASSILGIPIPDKIVNLMPKLDKLAREAVETYESGIQSYPNAESELLERFNYNKISDHPRELYYFEDLSQLGTSRRYDPEHFQPMYKRLREQLKIKGHMTIYDIALKVNRGLQPTFVENGDVAVIDSKSIRSQGVVVDEDECTSMDIYSDPKNSKAIVKCGDVLLNSTGVGTLGRASFYQENKPAMADNHVTIIKTDEAKCQPVYLSLFLNSPLGISQCEMFQTGSSGQVEIYPQHIKRISVYIPYNKNGTIDIKWQKDLAKMVNRASLSKTNAAQKLSAAIEIIDDAMG